MMNGGMMIGMAFVWLLIVAVLILAVVALVKYIRSDRSKTP
jgi:TRAP-type mannitol/chloroaromatic compound transport system permease small subunit